MNPLTNMKNVVKLSEQELKNTGRSSWHDQYKGSAWIFIGGLPYDLTEGDIICIFSQCGEVVNINLIREKDTGKSKGFCFLCYEDQRSTILAVDNFNGIKLLQRTIRVDHVQDYKVPKEGKKTDEETKQLYAEGCAPKAAPITPKIETPKQDVRETLADQIEGDLRLPARLPIYTNVKSEKNSDEDKKIKKDKKKKNKKKKSKKKKSKRSESSNEDTESSESERDKNSTKVESEREDSRTNSEDRDRSRRDKRRSDFKHSSSHRNDRSDYGSSRSKNEKNSSKRSNRSRSRDKTEKPKSHKRDMSPNIPKRWR